MTTTAAVHLRATAQPAGDGLLGLVFELTLQGGTPLDLPAFAPFLAFTLQAQAQGQALLVQQPRLDLPLQAVTLRLAPGTALRLQPPVRLRLAATAAGAGAAADPLVWTISPAPAGLHTTGLALRVQLQLPPPLDLGAEVELPA